MLLDIKFFEVGSYGFWENLGLTSKRPLERKKFPVISSLEGRGATTLGASAIKRARYEGFWEVGRRALWC